MRQPHIFLIMTDQQKASATGCYGNPLVSTPTMDQLAAEGALYEHAHAPTTICTPCRTSIMTGVSPLVHRVLCHQDHAPANLRQLPELLAEAGYCAVAAGHYESDRSLNRGWTHEIEVCASFRPTGRPARRPQLRRKAGHQDCQKRWIERESRLTRQQQRLS